MAATSRASAPREAGERFLGVQDAGEVLEYGTKRGSAGSGFRGTDQEVERGVSGSAGGAPKVIVMP